MVEKEKRQPDVIERALGRILYKDDEHLAHEHMEGKEHILHDKHGKNVSYGESTRCPHCKKLGAIITLNPLQAHQTGHAYKCNYCGWRT